jgi:ATP synthase protein I
MPEENGKSTPPSSTDLDAFEVKLAAARAHREAQQSPKTKVEDNSLLGLAWRLSTELLASVLVGLFLGWGIDTIFGTRPWGLLIGLGLGMAAGFVSVFRTADAMDAKTAHRPKGTDLPEFDMDD